MCACVERYLFLFANGFLFRLLDFCAERFDFVFTFIYIYIVQPMRVCAPVHVHSNDAHPSSHPTNCKCLRSNDSLSCDFSEHKFKYKVNKYGKCQHWCSGVANGQSHCKSNKLNLSYASEGTAPYLKIQCLLCRITSLLTI